LTAASFHFGPPDLKSGAKGSGRFPVSRKKHEVFYKGLQKHQVTYRIMAILNPTLAAEPTQINYQIWHQYLMVNRDFPIGLLV
jgi:hypothetical protein